MNRGVTQRHETRPSFAYRRVSAFLLVVMLLAGCRTTARTPSAEVLANARQELEERGRADQEVREGFGVGGNLDTAQVRRMMHSDSSNTAWLKTYVARWGFPTSAQMGHEAVNAAFLIVQHSIQDTAFMRSMLPAVEEASKRGDLKGGDVAMLFDRVEVKAGRPQRYGTQLSLHDGHWVLDPIADSAHVDERRREMGLPPLSVYLRMVDSVLSVPSGKP